METKNQKKLQTNDEWTARKPYTKPEVKRVDLALAETLSIGCKLESFTAFRGRKPDMEPLLRHNGMKLAA